MQGKATDYWRALIVASNWQIGYNSYGGAQRIPNNYPTAYTIIQNEPDPENAHNAPSPQRLWIGNSTVHSENYPSVTALQALFDATNSQINFPFPLAVPLNDVFLGQNGWPTLNINDWTPYSPPGPYGAKPVPPGPVFSTSVALTRDAGGKDFLLKITVVNNGMRSATNVEVTAATLGGVKTLDSLPLKRKRLAPGSVHILSFRFSTTAGASGQTVILRITGKYKSGSFGGSLRIKLP